jgi:ProP effector
MGFEQLAALKEQLAKRAEIAPTKKPRTRRSAPAASSKPVDPVVRTIGKLQKRFPRAFPKNPAPKVPLKIGIFEDLMVHATELGLSERELRGAIKVWCRGNRYWTCLVEGANRLDLTGAPAGEVTSADAGRATQFETNRSARSTSTAEPANPREHEPVPHTEPR